MRDSGPGKSPVVLVDITTCLVLGKISPVKRRNSRGKKGGLNFPLKHRVRDRRDGLKAPFPGYSKFTTRAQRDVGRQMDSVPMSYSLGERASTWWISAADTKQHAWGAPRGTRGVGHSQEQVVCPSL